MTHSDRTLSRALAGAWLLLAALGCSISIAQEQASTPSTDANVPPATAQKQARELAQGSPARWFREDPSLAARLRTVQKEIAAGLQEAHGACRKLPGAERAGCNKEAQAIYKHDMAGARQQVTSDSAAESGR